MRDTPDFDIPDSAPKAAVSIRYDPDGFKPDQVNPLDDIKKLNDLNHNLVAAFRRITADDSLDNVTPEIPSVDPPPGDGGGVGGGGGSGPGPVDEPEEPESAGFTDVDADGVHAASIDALFEAGLTVGCAREPLRFCGDRPVTRAQMATLLVRALDLPPARSAGFTDVDADGSVILTWDAPDDDSVSGYLILRRRPCEGEQTLLVYVENTGSTATTFTDTGVTAGTQHVYRVKAVNGAGAGERSNYVNVNP